MINEQENAAGPRVPSEAEWPSLSDWKETRPSSEEEEVAELAWSSFRRMTEMRGESDQRKMTASPAQQLFEASDNRGSIVNFTFA